MKEKFFKFLGSEHDLNGYQRSYKLVLYKYLFEFMDDQGYASSYDVIKSFRDFYTTRIKQGLPPDYHVDDRIKYADKSSIREISDLIDQNPYKAINGQGYLSKEIKFEEQGGQKLEYFRLAPELISELTPTDIDEIKEIVEKKLTLYFSKMGGEEVADLQSLFNFVLNGYLDAKRQPITSHPIANALRSSFPDEIYKSSFITKQEYQVTGSPGQGNWASVPWVGVFQRSITSNATKGVYIVYLFSSDCSSVYLTLNQGCTELKEKYGKTKAIEIMKEIAANTIASLDSRGFSTGDHIDLKDTRELPYLYERGTIFYKEYKKGNIPNNDVLISDLKNMNEIYLEYIASMNQNKFEWAPFYMELADKILEYKNKRPELIKLMQESSSQSGLVFTFNEEDKTPLEDMCPFTFFTSFNRGTKDENRKALLSFYKDRLDLRAEVPSKFDGVPVVSALNSYFFGWKKDRKDDDIDNLWRVYEAAILYADTASQDYKQEFEKWFNITKGQHGVKWNLTIGLYWIRPYSFLNLDERNRGYLKKNNEIAYLTNNAFTSIKYYVPSAEEYLNYIDICKNKIFSQHEKIKDFPTLSRYAWLSKDNKEVEDDEVKSIKQNIEQIHDFIKSKGFTFEEDQIKNFYLSLKSKPFVILAGTSGTGKTRLVKLFAEAIDAEYLLVPVRPDWSDSSDLFGHLDLNGRFIEGSITQFVKNANLRPDKSHILCLDEMNLARVEYYFSDFLSVIETRELRNGSIVSAPLVKANIYGASDAINQYGEMGFPENLYIVGTVNMDETTFPFSRKVLDRANTIEFSYVELIPDEEIYNEKIDPMDLNNDFLKSKYLLLKDNDDNDYTNKICTILHGINQILQKADAHVGYRVRDEIVFYMLNNKNADLLPENDALDNEIMQKILPRVQGSNAKTKNLLIELFQFCAGDFTALTGSNTFELMTQYINTQSCKYKKSARKIAFMIGRFEDDGVTSYWL